ncbi:heat shock protein transcriptional repressor HspR [Kitasatospora purpeofusca]|uniref:Helix-turn-helix transcriptional regulator n=1 Tax=Kitasatospora purpeofusca TaxID=67352 RepID=A0ABZ1UFC9_9ACTN|nr:helix-turn-helix transcriptional regulator [Kitasatospora purpeofusca]
MTADDRTPYDPADDTPIYVISVAAKLSGLHPQTLRQYDRIGLVSPSRAVGRGRRYSARDIELLRRIQQLSQEQGINLAGIRRITELEARVTELQELLTDLQSAVAPPPPAPVRAPRYSLVRYQAPQPDGPLAVWRLP